MLRLKIKSSRESKRQWLLEKVIKLYNLNIKYFILEKKLQLGITIIEQPWLHRAYFGNWYFSNVRGHFRLENINGQCESCANYIIIEACSSCLLTLNETERGGEKSCFLFFWQLFNLTIKCDEWINHIYKIIYDYDYFIVKLGPLRTTPLLCISSFCILDILTEWRSRIYVRYVWFSKRRLVVSLLWRQMFQLHCICKCVGMLCWI